MNSSGNHQPATEADFTPLAIIGMGGIFPQAENLMQFWRNIREGVDSITDIPASHWNPDQLYDPDPKKRDHVYGNKGGFLPAVDFEPMKYGVLPNALEAIDTSQLLGLVAVEQALNDAGYGPGVEFNREQVSVILGVTGALELVIPLGARLGHPRWRAALQQAGVDDETAQDVIDRIADSYTEWQENSFPGLLGNVVAGRISKHFNFSGTNCVVDAACGSSLSAINLAALELATGRADMVITGGVDTFNDVFMYSCFSKTPALSPSGHARPFAADADGTTLGEAIGIVVLKRLADAERDGDRIYAVIKGLGTSSDGSNAAIYEPDASGQQKAVRRAYAQGGVSPRSIGLIEAHGTGTRVGDGIEVKALQQVFGEAAHPWCALGSVKSQIGHTKAAAGAAGLIKSALALYHKVLPPSIKVDRPRDELLAAGTPFFINRESRPWLGNSVEPRRAGVSALGFGGSNYHCLLEEYASDKPGRDWAHEVQWFALSADNREHLGTALAAIPADLSDWNAVRRAAAATRQGFDAAAPYRLCWVVQRGANGEEQRQRITRALQGDEAEWQTPDGAFFSTRPCDGRTAVLFPGQGASYPGMLHDLALSFPSFFGVLHDADRYFPGNDGQPLSEYIYPRSFFDADHAEAAARALQATEVAQPALGAVSLAGFSLLREFGLRMDACAGHSYGELTALCAAGVLRADDFHRLSRVRGELMAAAADGGGAMLAVFAPLERIEAMIESQGWDVVLANRNSPAQGVLSGSEAAIAAAAEYVQAQGLACKQLDVAAAFHSIFVSDAVAPFAEYLDNIDWCAADAAVYANTTAAAYPDDTEAARRLLAEQLANPVAFVDQIEAMYRDGVRTFVEIGPHARLSAMVKAILGDREYQTLALDASQGKQSGIYDFACVLAQLSTLGQPIDGSLWDDAVPPAVIETKRVLRIPLCGANPFNPKTVRPPRPRTATPPKEAPVMQQPQSPSAAAPGTAASSSVAASSTTPSPAPVTVSGAVPQASAPLNAPMLQQGLQLLQDIQVQTSRLHEQFLKGQEEATRAMMNLLSGGITAAPHTPPTIPAPAIVSQPAPAPAPVAPLVPAAPAVVTPPPAAVKPTVMAPAAPAKPGNHDAVAAIVFGIVAEKTGYPQEMLESGMSLDGDLGIDSIKRVEILSAVQTALPDAPVITPEDLGVLQTLGQMVEHLAQHSSTASVTTASLAVSAASRDAVAAIVFGIVAEKTGYPQEMLESSMSLDGDLGIDSIKRVEILSAVQTALPDAPVITPEDLGVLQTLGQMVEHLAQHSGTATVTTVSPAVSAASRDAVAAIVFGIVAEKTGYPQEMLESGMSLDSDLGIDSIKRVEILSAVQTALPDAPVITPEDLGVLQTLGQMVEHLAQHSSTATVTTASPAASAASRDAVAAIVFGIVAEKTGYPQDMLESGMSLDSDLGIDSIKRVEILSAVQTALPDAPVITPEHMGQLRTLADIIGFLAVVKHAAPQAVTPVGVTGNSSDHHDSAAPASVRCQHLALLPWESEGLPHLTVPEGARCWLLADDSTFSTALSMSLMAAGYDVDYLTPGVEVEMPDTLHALFMVAPQTAMSDELIWQYFAILQQAETALRLTPDSVLATISHMDGQFGLSGELADARSGGLHGMLKTAHQEWPEVCCTAFDLPANRDEVDPAVLVAAARVTEGPLEIACSADGLAALHIYEAPQSECHNPLPVSAGDLVVVSGGARGVTAHVSIALARASRATLLLLGRSELRDEAAWLSGIEGEAAIKQALMQHSGTPLTPRELGRAYQRVLAQREVRATMAAIEEAGGRAIYRSVDVTNSDDVAWLIGEVRAQHGPVKGLIHGAGVLADRLIGDKTRDQFDSVYGTKVQGLRALLAATEHDPLAFMVLFSSSTGRFGRRGQVDYAVANEVLNKEAQVQAARRSDCRVIAPNWGPWDGGMVTPALKQVFADEGIEVIDLDAGAAFMLNELRTAPGGAVEMVVLGAHATNDEPQAEALASNPPSLLDMPLTLDDYPFLTSHVMNHQAVLPMAMMVEWMAHAAVHANPGLLFHGFESLRVLKAVTLQHHQQRVLRFACEPLQCDDDGYRVAVELRTVNDEREVPHARCIILLGEHYPDAPHAAPLPDLQAWPHPMHTVYQDNRLFHGPDLHALVEITGIADDAIHARVLTAPSPDQWIENPVSGHWQADPLALDGSFQLMILWAFERHGMGSLPVYAGAYHQYAAHFPDDGVDVRIRVTDDSAAQAEAVIEWIDPANGRLLARMDDYRCVLDASLATSFMRTDLHHDEA